MKKKNAKTNNNGSGKLIFFLALLCIYFILTIFAAVIFEYQTVSVSGGEIIFSASMSWQMVIFLIEAVTIVVQFISIILFIKNKSNRLIKTITFTGAAAGLTLIISTIVLIISDGYVVNPTLVFAIYAVLVTSIRSVLLPVLVHKQITITDK